MTGNRILMTGWVMQHKNVNINQRPSFILLLAFQSHTSSSAYLYDRLIRAGHSRLARHTIAGQDVTLSPF